MALPPLSGFALEEIPGELPGLPTTAFQGAGIPAAPLPPVDGSLLAAEPALPAQLPGLAALGQTPELIGAAPSEGAPLPAPVIDQLPAPFQPPMVAPPVEEIERRTALPAELPPTERAPEQAARTAQVLADVAEERGSREAGYLRGFSQRIEDIQRSDAAARADVAANVEQIQDRMRRDGEELRALSREAAGPLATGTKAGILAVGAMQAIKSLIGAGQADVGMIDQLLGRDADAKARAVTEARRRMGVTEGELGTELERFQQIDYMKRVALADSWEQIAADLQSDAAAEKDAQLKIQKLQAADQAAAAARQAGADAQRAAFNQELVARKAMADIALTEAKTREASAKATREERRAAGVGRRKDTPTMQSVEAQLRTLEPEELKRVETRGIRGSAGDFLVAPDGSFVVGNTVEEAKKLRGQWGGLQSVNDSLNRLDTLRAEYGMEWSISNSDALQDMKSTMAELELKLKDTYQLGVLSDSDLAMLQKITGGDPTGWFDKRPTWAAMRSRIEGGFNRELRAHSSYKGQFKLPVTKPVQRTLQQISEPIDRPYDPQSGKLVSTSTRLAALEEERMRLATEGGTAGGLTLATEIGIERAEERINKQHRALMDRMFEDRRVAREAGDDARVRQLTKSMDEQRQFTAQADDWLAKQRKKLETLPAEEKRRARQAAEVEQVVTGGRVGAGAKPGALF